MSFTLYEKFKLRETFILLEEDNADLATLEKLITDIKAKLSNYTADSLNKVADEYDADVKLGQQMKELHNNVDKLKTTKAGWDAIKQSIAEYMDRFTELFGSNQLMLVNSQRTKDAYTDFRDFYQKDLTTEAERAEGLKKFELLANIVEDTLQNPDNQMLDVRAEIVPVAQQLTEFFNTDALLNYAKTDEGAKQLPEIIQDTKDVQEIISADLASYEDAADFMAGIKTISKNLQAYLKKYSSTASAEVKDKTDDEHAKAEEEKKKAWEQRYQEADGPDAKNEVLNEFIKALLAQPEWSMSEDAVNNFGTNVLKAAIRQYGFNLNTNPIFVFFDKIRKDNNIMSNMTPTKAEVVTHAIQSDPGTLTVQDLMQTGPLGAQNIIFKADFYKFKTADLYNMDLLLKYQHDILAKDGQSPKAMKLIPDDMQSQLLENGKIKAVTKTIPNMFYSDGKDTLRPFMEIKTMAEGLIGQTSSAKPAFDLDTDLMKLLLTFKVITDKTDTNYTNMNLNKLALLLGVLRYSYVNNPEQFLAEINKNTDILAAYRPYDEKSNPDVSPILNAKNDNAKYLNTVTIDERTAVEIASKLVELFDKNNKAEK